MSTPPSVTAHKKSNAKKRATRKAKKTGVTAQMLTQHLQHARHRAAILEQVAQRVQADFIGMEKPEYAIGDDDGCIELANPTVVMDVSVELSDMADRERKRIRQLLAMDVAELSPSDCPVHDEDEDDANERVFDEAVLNIDEVGGSGARRGNGSP